MNLDLEKVFGRRIVVERSAGPLFFKRKLEVPQEWKILKFMEQNKAIQIDRKNKIQRLGATDVDNLIFMTVKYFFILKLIPGTIVLGHKQGWLFGKDEICSDDIDAFGFDCLFVPENFFEINSEYSLVES
jgi:hypothetical protein